MSTAGNDLDRLLANAATLASADDLKTILTDLSAFASVESESELSAALHIQRLASFIGAWGRRSTPELMPRDETVRRIWKPAMDMAFSILASDNALLQLREAAVSLVAQGALLGERHVETLVALLTPRTPPELQSAVVDALKNDGSEQIAEILLSDWAAREPRLRKEAIAMLLSRPSWTQRLIVAITDRTVSMIELDLSKQQSLLDHPDQNIREAAALNFKPKTSASRQQVIDRYSAAIRNDGDSAKGRQVFQRHCSVCHRIQDLGHAVGPHGVSDRRWPTGTQ